MSQGPINITNYQDFENIKTHPGIIIIVGWRGTGKTTLARTLQTKYTQNNIGVDVYVLPERDPKDFNLENKIDCCFLIFSGPCHYCASS